MPGSSRTSMRSFMPVSFSAAVPMYLPIWANWRHMANTIELVLPSVHPSPQPKWQVDQLSRFCTAHGRKSLYITMSAPFPKNCSLLWGIWIHLIYYSLVYPKPHPKQHLDRFSHFCIDDRIVFLYFTMGRPFTQNCPFPWAIWTPGVLYKGIL